MTREARTGKHVPTEKFPSPRMMSGQLTVMSIMVGMVPLLCLGTLLYVYYDAAYRDKTRTLLGEQVLRNAQSIDAFLDEKMANLRQQAALASPEELSDPIRLRDRLLGLQNAYQGVFTSLELIDATGRTMAQAGGGASGPDHSGEAWFEQAINSPQHVRGFGSRPANVFLSVRITTPQGLWLLLARLDPRLSEDKSRAFHPGGRGGAFVLDRDGNAPAEASEKTVPLETQRLLAGQVFPEGRPVVLEAMDASGELQWFACAPLKSTGGVLVFHQPRTELLLTLNKARALALAIAILGCFGIVATAMAMARRTEARLRKADFIQQQMQRQVVEAGKLAAIGELAAGIAHEINNPLAIMMENAGWIQDLLTSDDPDSEENKAEILSSLQTIATQGHRCREITHKLLGFARKTETSSRVVQVNPMLEDIAGFARQKARYRGVEIALDLDPEAGDVDGSPTEVQQIILNLVNNAIDATEKGNGQVLLRSVCEKACVAIEVKDNGQGIPAEILPRIFEPFFTTKPAGQGTGLGLAICRDILTRMNGSISVDSAPGQGATFRVRLPLRP
jgi:two-component system NtrC family sensor kinase